MTERTYVSRNAFFVAGTAAVLMFLALLWLGMAGDRSRTRDRDPAPAEKRVTRASQGTPPSSTPANRASLAAMDPWTPPPAEFVKLTKAVSLHNSRGKVVKQFDVGKRLRVNNRAGDEVTIDYLGEEYTIAAAATVPSQ